MPRRTRRDALRLCGLGAGAALAGCLGDAENDDEPDDPMSIEEDPPEEPNEAEESPELVDATTVHLEPTLSAPDWYVESESTTAAVTVLDSEKRVREAIDLAARTGDRHDGATSLVASTDFETSVLLLVETVGPNTCYRSVDVSEVQVRGPLVLTLDDETSGNESASTSDDEALIRADTAAVDTCEDDAGDGGVGAGQALTFPAALVRVTVDGPVPDTAKVTVTDGWGQTSTVSASASGTPLNGATTVPGHVRPDGEPATIPAPLTCEDESFERHGQYVPEKRVEWGTATGEDGAPRFEMRVDRTSVRRGESVTVTMTNATDREQYTGIWRKYNLQVRTEAGWQDVRGAPDGGSIAYTDEAVVHEPGEGFEWTIEITPQGILDGPYGKDFAVCPGLPAGRYRFLFWEPAVAVAFDLRR
ncbi:hypothetical protein SAMN06269185_3085 [Natronoarchaeum philippinense]|uniref:Uncharacterized protein n=1 Tax=Natronoarchaeum philippinense TaxID=558529 RepID=A0A285P7G9_NATPI|nr:hypothetical protein [Natronoarchaeum philippinense]SNZ17685.1 hypothetical protein SAMN06269185_3085 [Natronoarchaeum philippinense]